MIGQVKIRWVIGQICPFRHKIVKMVLNAVFNAIIWSYIDNENIVKKENILVSQLQNLIHIQVATWGALNTMSILQQLLLLTTHHKCTKILWAISEATHKKLKADLKTGQESNPNKAAIVTTDNGRIAASNWGSRGHSLIAEQIS